MTDHAASIRAACSGLADALIAALRDSEPAVPERLLDVKSAAEALGGISRTTVYNEMASGSGRLRSVKVGRRRLIPMSAIDEYVRSRDGKE